MEVVKHIHDNFLDSSVCLKTRVYQKIPLKNENIKEKCKQTATVDEPEKDSEDKCKKFLDGLSVDAWGGSETFKAFSEKYKVNIFVMNDDGTSNIPNRFEISHKKSLIIFYSNKSHYDSVVSISEETLLKHAKPPQAQLGLPVSQNQCFYLVRITPPSFYIYMSKITVLRPLIIYTGERRKFGSGYPSKIWWGYTIWSDIYTRNP